ncbi:MAG: GNAT family N-acetyltransferase [Cyanothece sp. SIO1E1]|nr:GNAT family N-acetyltransferase [Cyanothece sp. SIO1E1]
MFKEAFSDPETTRHLQWDIHRSIEETIDLVQEMIEQQRKGEKYFWIAMDQRTSRPVGFGSIQPDNQTAWIGIMVFKSEKRKGFGKKLLSALESSVLNNYDSSLAMIEKDNVGSLALFESAGWQQQISERNSKSITYKKTRSSPEPSP